MHKIQTAADIDQFVGLLAWPRAMILLVPAGKAVDTVIESLQGHLEFDDLIIDAGNSNFKDTSRRLQIAGERRLGYLGKGSAGHYVKMVHNGIEYGIMQLIAEEPACGRPVTL
jgi:6-phosphogluconate dehydrogenase